METHAVFHSGSVTPVMAGEIPTEIHPLVTCCREDAKKLFDEMVLSTKEYLDSYDLTKL